METAVQSSNEYRNLPVAQLQESTTNPRRRFDEHSLAELAFSFQAQGVLQPLLVRTIEDDKYEVIAGARRLRAAKLAALEEVPVRVVELSDAACVETQLVENIQRENAHPLEEAFAFHGLLHTDGLQYDIASLAAKTGKSPAFVATRLRLVELHPSIAEAFWQTKSAWAMRSKSPSYRSRSNSGRLMLRFIPRGTAGKKHAFCALSAT
jgi:ParB family chromosome partitioning protein